MNQTVIQALEKLIEEGKKLVPQGGHPLVGYTGSLQTEYVSWRMQSLIAIEFLGSPAERLKKEIESDKDGPYFYKSSAQRVLGCLQAALEIAKKAKAETPTEATRAVKKKVPSSKVFIVHGHDEATREATARFIEKLGLTPVILHEQPSKGRTIIEKFEDYADVGFAIILLTPDDVGAACENPKDLLPRARQNVIFELGYFIGALGRERVVALYKKDVEIPSDYQGVVFIPFDEPGSWKLPLAKELKTAGMDIDLNKVIDTNIVK